MVWAHIYKDESGLFVVTSDPVLQKSLTELGLRTEVREHILTLGDIDHERIQGRVLEEMLRIEEGV